jgi:hypothetical protein
VAHVFADPFVADEASAAVDFEDCVAREQVGDVFPLRFVDGLTIGALKVGDSELVLRCLRPAFELFDAVGERADRIGGDRGVVHRQQYWQMPFSSNSGNSPRRLGHGRGNPRWKRRVSPLTSTRGDQ